MRMLRTTIMKIPSNTTMSSMQEDWGIYKSSSILVAYTVTCSSILIVGLFMNACTVYMYVTKRIQQTHFNYCLKHLSITSIVQYLGFIPMLAVNLKKVPTNGLLSKLTCGISFGLSAFFCATFVSVYIVNVMSIERFQIINKPIRNLTLSNKRNTKLFFIFWVLGIILLTPNILTYDLDQKHGICVRSYTKYGKDFIYIYSYLLVLLALPIPVIVMVGTYILTIYQLYRKKSEARLRHRRHIVKLLGMIIGIFLVCWVPFGVWWLLGYLGNYEERMESVYKEIRIARFTLVPALCAPILNVLTFGMTNMQFRRSFQLLTKRKKPHIILHIIP